MAWGVAGAWQAFRETMSAVVDTAAFAMSGTSRGISVDHPRAAVHGITIVDNGNHFDKLPEADRIAHAVSDTPVDLSMTPQDRARAVLDRSRHVHGLDLVKLDRVDYESLYWTARFNAENADEVRRSPHVFQEVRAAQKFDTPPTLGTYEDIEAVIQNGGTELFMRVPSDRLPEFYRGEYFPTESSGTMGTGMETWTQRYHLELPGRAPDDTQIIRMALLPGTFTANVNDLIEFQTVKSRILAGELHDRTESGDELAAAKIRSQLWFMNDMGTYWMARRIEAITFDHRVSVLNSSALLIQTDPIR